MNKRKIFSRISLISLLVFSIAFSSYSQTGRAPVVIDSAKAKDYYLEMKGTIKRYTGAADVNEEKLPILEGATVTVLEGTKQFLKVETNDKGKCTFKLPLERIFRIQVSKKGYVTKFFEVNTYVPKINLGAFPFTFNLDIFEEIKKLDVKVLKKPIAKVTFDPIYNQFQYDDSYTSRINFEIKKMYKNYYEIEKAQADSIEKFNKTFNQSPKKEESQKTPDNKTTAPPKK